MFNSSLLDAALCCTAAAVFFAWGNNARYRNAPKPVKLFRKGVPLFFAFLAVLLLAGAYIKGPV